jgi:translation initiation factor IF-3
MLNYDIKSPTVDLVFNGEIKKKIAIKDAMMIAKEHNLDLVQVSNEKGHPTCKIMDYGKMIYEKKKQQKKTIKKSQALKEVKFRPSTGIGDINTKVGKINDFLEKGHEVKITIQFKGRENAHKDIGFNLMDKIMKLISCEFKLKQKVENQGRLITCIIKQ